MQGITKHRFTQEIDQALKDIVNMAKSSTQKFSWNRCANQLYEKTQVKFQPKQCQNRYKNFLSNTIDVTLKLKPSQKDQVFDLHCEGHSNLKIKQILNKPKLSDNQLKKCCKVEKEKMGRVLRQIYQTQIKQAQISSQSPNQHYRVLLVLLSRRILLKYYFDEHKLRITELKDLLNKYKLDKKRLQTLKKKQKLSLKLKLKNLTSQANEETLPTKQTLETSVLDIEKKVKMFVMKIYDAYSKIPKSISSIVKFKNSRSKIKQLFTRRIILGIPSKLDQQLQQIPELMIQDSSQVYCYNKNDTIQIYYQDDEQRFKEKGFTKPLLNSKTTQDFNEYEKQNQQSINIEMNNKNNYEQLYSEF